MEANLEAIAIAECYENGKPVRETLMADIPLAIDQFRYFASAIRAQEGGISQIDEDTVAYHFHEPLGVVGQIIPWNFPILMAVWKIAPALAAGNCIVMKPAEQTPASILYMLETIGIADLLPKASSISSMVLGLKQVNHWPLTHVSTKLLLLVRLQLVASLCSMPAKTSFLSP